MRFWVLVLAATIAASPAFADDVTDQLDAAAAAYRQHDFGAALTDLESATALLRQHRADAWKSLLPVPLPGWTAEDAQTTSLSPALLGGVTSASRVYRRDGERVEISLLTDSPILQGVGAMVSSILSAGAGARTVVINGRRLTYLKDDNSYTAMVGDKVMVKVQADGATNEDAVRQYLAAIDFAAIEKASR